MLIEVDNFKVVTNPTRPKLVKRHSADQPAPAAGAGRSSLAAWRAERGKAIRPQIEARMVAERDARHAVKRAIDKEQMDAWLAQHQGQCLPAAPYRPTVLKRGVCGQSAGIGKRNIIRGLKKERRTL